MLRVCAFGHSSKWGLLAAVGLLSSIFVGCGGGGSGSSQMPPGDFSLAASPAGLTLGIGSMFLAKIQSAKRKLQARVSHPSVGMRSASYKLEGMKTYLLAHSMSEDIDCVSPKFKLPRWYSGANLGNN